MSTRDSQASILPGAEIAGGRVPRATVAAMLAAIVPSLLAYNLPPSPTLFNQAAAVALWGVLACVQVGHRREMISGATAPLQSALGLIALATVAALWMGLPNGLGLSAVGLIGASIVMVASGAAARNADRSAQLVVGFFSAWLTAGVLSMAVALVQVFAPAWPDGDLIARSGLAGRAVGNLRQPNHLSSLLLWSAAAVVPLFDGGRLKRGVAVFLFALLCLGIVLSGSRTGMAGVLVLALWGMLDRRLRNASRGLLISAPLWFGLFWLLMSWWAQYTNNTFGAAAHVAGADPSSSRFAIWSNTLALVARHPWTGAGFGEFNFAWSLTPFPDRPVAFFDHTHNLPLQLVVELGLPLAGLILGLLAWALWRAWRNSSSADRETGVRLRGAFVMVLMMALHSQLEYPLWYAYFLLPTAWAWGYCLGLNRATHDTRKRGQPNWLFAGGVAMVLAGAIAVADYWRVVQIFAPNHDAPSLDERIADGQRSLLFAHHADYAAVTTADEPVLDPRAFDRAPHYLLDARLMIAWSKALAAQGKLDHARHIAQRLREFRNPASDEFFAPCTARAPRPFQCDPPSRVVDWREFR